MTRKTISLLLLWVVVQTIMAGVPEGYYARIDGEMYTDLKSALCNVIKNHKVLGYSSLWEYYPSTYFVPENPQQVRDMYSDEVRYYAGNGSQVASMNKEHTVPKSWWGGSTSAAPGNDLYNVIPSDQTANSRKSNYPLGEVKNQTWTNGVTTVGSGTVGGYTGNMFEPKDEYKGDFARIYFYMAVCYPDQAWDSNNANAMTNTSALTLKSWIIPMLLAWHAADPVNAEEIQRNDNIYKVQGNRNPFIDYPELADYIWGAKNHETFELTDHQPNTGGGSSTLFAGNAKFSLEGGSANDPLTVAQGTIVTVKGYNEKAVLRIRINNGEWEELLPKKGYNSTTQSEYYTAAQKDVPVNGSVRIDAYCTAEGREDSQTLTYYYKGVDFSEEFLLHESFDEVKNGDNVQTSGSSSSWSGNDNFPTVVKTYQAGNAIKVGTGSASGSITSRKLQYAGGSVDVTLDVKGWTTVEGSLSVSMTGAESQIVKYSATMSDDFEHISLTFDNVSDSPQLTIATTSKRAFLDNITVTAKNLNGIDAVSESKASMTAMPMYNLSGQRVTATHKGIILINGRKFLNR